MANSQLTIFTAQLIQELKSQLAQIEKAENADKTALSIEVCYTSLKKFNEWFLDNALNKGHNLNAYQECKERLFGVIKLAAESSIELYSFEKQFRNEQNQESNSTIYFSNLLTKREVEILNYTRRGLTYKEIGTELFISTNTVKKHIENIYSKLGVSNKMEMITRLENKVAV